MAFQPSPLIGEGPGQVLHERSDEGVGLLDLPLWASTNPVWMFGPATLEALGILSRPRHSYAGRRPRPLSLLSAVVAGAGATSRGDAGGGRVAAWRASRRRAGPRAPGTARR